MKKTLNFVGRSKIFFGISLAIILVGIICNVIFGTTLDIQFKGGSVVKYSFTGDIDDAALKDTIQKATPNNKVTFSISRDKMNDDGKKEAYIIDINFSGEKNISIEQQNTLTKSLKETFKANNFEYSESTTVDAAMGFNFLLKCLTAVVIACVLMVVYVTIRFKYIGGFSAGVMALVALFHDVAMIYFMYVIFKMPIDSNFIAVVLMILGYSLNDTIVIYDRVRENRKLMGPKADIADVFNKSATGVLGRTIWTSITTLTAIGTVYVVATIFNLDSVQSFALPMMIGVLSGCYSSICIAGPLWVMWKKKKADKNA